MIKIKRVGEGDPLEFEVIVCVGNGETRHHVTMARDTCERLTMGTHTPERCIEAAFRFLLDREPKESILRRFRPVTLPSSSAHCQATSPNPEIGPVSVGNNWACWTRPRIGSGVGAVEAVVVRDA